MSTSSDHAIPLNERPDRPTSDDAARHDLTAPRVRRLRTWNIALTVLHAAQAIAVLVIASGVSQF